MWGEEWNADGWKTLRGRGRCISSEIVENHCRSVRRGMSSPGVHNKHNNNNNIICFKIFSYCMVNVLEVASQDKIDQQRTRWEGEIGKSFKIINETHLAYQKGLAFREENLGEKIGPFLQLDFILPLLPLYPFPPQVTLQDTAH